MSKKKVLLRGVFINRDTNGEGVLKVGTTLIRVSTVMGILYSWSISTCKGKEITAMNLLHQIDTTDFSENELLILEYFIAHEKSLPYMSLNDICKDLFISNATIVRFCQKSDSMASTN